MITKEKARQIALEYQKVGYKDKTTPLLAVGYSKSYASTLGHKLYNNIKVKEEIDRLQAKKEEKIELNRQLVTNNMINAAKIALKNNDMANYIRATENLGKNQGWYEADNLQRKEEAELSEEMRKKVEEYERFRELEMLNPDLFKDITKTA